MAGHMSNVINMGSMLYLGSRSGANLQGYIFPPFPGKLKPLNFIRQLLNT